MRHLRGPGAGAIPILSEAFAAEADALLDLRIGPRDIRYDGTPASLVRVEGRRMAPLIEDELRGEFIVRIPELHGGARSRKTGSRRATSPCDRGCARMASRRSQAAERASQRPPKAWPPLADGGGLDRRQGADRRHCPRSGLAGGKCQRGSCGRCNPAPSAGRPAGPIAIPGKWLPCRGRRIAPACNAS